MPDRLSRRSGVEDHVARRVLRTAPDLREGSEMKAGWKTWLVVAGWVIGAVIVVEGFFLLFGWAWYSWGFFGAFLVICVLALAWAYFYDRRRANRRKRLAA